MSFKIDKQTLDDLAIFGSGRTKSIYEIYNKVSTRGGGRLLEEMFRYPLSNEGSIRKRVNTIHYYGEHQIAFPFQPCSMLWNFIWSIRIAAHN